MRPVVPARAGTKQRPGPFGPGRYFGAVESVLACPILTSVLAAVGDCRPVRFMPPHSAALDPAPQASDPVGTLAYSHDPYRYGRIIAPTCGRQPYR